MRILLAIFTCHRYDYSHPEYVDWYTRPLVARVPAIRDTWLKDVTVDYKFFYGRPPKGYDCPQGEDEVFLDCPDDYYHSYQKIQGVVAYARAHDYDKLLKVDDDVYVYWDRLMASIPSEDYVGGGAPNVPAGPAYWLSRKCLDILSTGRAVPWAEDLWVGTVLLNANITPTFNSRYHIAPQNKTNQYISDQDLYTENGYLTIHSLSPEQMRNYHKWRSDANPKMLSVI